MKKLVVLLALTTFGARANEKRRLESVTWDPVKHELRWVISKGELEGEEYKPASRQEYEISIDDATMSFADETRRSVSGRQNPCVNCWTSWHATRSKARSGGNRGKVNRSEN